MPKSFFTQRSSAEPEQSSVPVKVRDISKAYGESIALKPISFDIGAGELISLLGPSGCGKTTTLRILAGFIYPDTGCVILGGRDVTGIQPNRRGLGMVFQSYSLFPHMTVAENVAFGLKMRGVAAAERTASVREALTTVRLGSFEDRLPHELSGGQQQRVALARALITRPSVLLLDEPLGALDKNLRERMQFEIRDLQRRLGITTVLVTHDQEEAMTMSDRIAVMSAGELVQIGTPVAVYERPRTRFVSEFLGTSNVFEGTVEQVDAVGVATVRLSDGDNRVRARIADGLMPRNGKAVSVAVRPEKIHVSPARDNGVAAVLKSGTFRGSYYIYEFAIPGRDVPVIAFRQQALPDAEPGLTVALTWNDDAVALGD